MANGMGDTSVPFGFMRKIDRMNRGPDPVPLLRASDPMVYSTVEESHRELFSKEVLLNDGYNVLPVTSTSAYLLPEEDMPRGTYEMSDVPHSAVGLLRLRTPASFVSSGRLRTSASKMPPDSLYATAYEVERHQDPAARLNLRKVEKMASPEITVVASRNIAAMEEKASQEGVLLRRNKVEGLMHQSAELRAQVAANMAAWEAETRQTTMAFQEMSRKRLQEERAERQEKHAAMKGASVTDTGAVARPEHRGGGGQGRAPSPVSKPNSRERGRDKGQGGVAVNRVAFKGLDASGPHVLPTPAKFAIEEHKPLHQTTGAGFKMPRVARMPRWAEHERLLGAIAMGMERQRSHEAHAGGMAGPSGKSLPPR